MEKFEWKEDKVIDGIDPFIYLTANKFYKTAKIVDKGFTEPIIVNLSFAIELYLKCLNTKSTYSKKNNSDLPILERKLKTIYGHKFDEIFKKLKPIDQTNLSSQYSEKYHTDFSKDLVEIKNAFIDYRYSFEKDFLTINFTILNRVADFLKEYIENEMKQGKYYR